MTVWRMHFAFWITKSTNTHSEYVILIAFALLQLLHEHTSMVRYMYSACLVKHVPLSDKCVFVLGVYDEIYRYIDNSVY